MPDMTIETRWLRSPYVGVELKCPEADVIEGLIINAEGFVRVFDQLVNGEGGVVWLEEHESWT
jgi:hypothetical protein